MSDIDTTPDFEKPDMQTNGSEKDFIQAQLDSILYKRLAKVNEAEIRKLFESVGFLSAGEQKSIIKILKQVDNA